VNCTIPESPLVIATTHGLIDCVKYLLKAGADPNIPQCHVSFVAFLPVCAF
jgi:ankyrin repeat protein